VTYVTEGGDSRHAGAPCRQTAPLTSLGDAGHRPAGAEGFL